MGKCTRCKVNEGNDRRVIIDGRILDRDENLCDRCAYEINIQFNYGKNFLQGDKNGTTEIQQR